MISAFRGQLPHVQAGHESLAYLDSCVMEDAWNLLQVDSFRRSAGLHGHPCKNQPAPNGIVKGLIVHGRYDAGFLAHFDNFLQQVRWHSVQPASRTGWLLAIGRASSPRQRSNYTSAAQIRCGLNTISCIHSHDALRKVAGSTIQQTDTGYRDTIHDLAWSVLHLESEYFGRTRCSITSHEGHHIPLSTRTGPKNDEETAECHAEPRASGKNAFECLENCRRAKFGYCAVLYRY